MRDCYCSSGDGTRERSVTSSVVVERFTVHFYC